MEVAEGDFNFMNLFLYSRQAKTEGKGGKTPPSQTAGLGSLY